MTELTPKKLFEERNVDNVFTREVIAGLLRILNRKLIYEQIWNDAKESPEKVTVPFFFDFGEHANSEKFIQDNYIFFGDSGCSDIGIKKIDGNFDIIPRGAVSLESATIDSGNITNRFVLGKYNKKVGDTLQSFVAFLYSIPLKYSFKLEIRTDTYISMLKIDEAFRKYFYKNKTFFFNYNGTKIPCRCGFGESLGMDKGAAYTMGTYDTDKYFKLTMTLDVETYQPVFDKSSEMPYNSTIKNFAVSVRLKEDIGLDKIWFINNYDDMILPANSDIFLEWNYTYHDKDANGFNVVIIDESTNEETVVAENVKTLYYDWHTPDSHSLAEPIDIIFEDLENCHIYKDPVIYVMPDPVTKAVKPENVMVSSKGFFITDDTDKAAGYFSYTTKNGKIEDIPFSLNLLNNQIDLDAVNGPVEFNDFVYQNDINIKSYTIRVIDATNATVYAEARNVKIL